MLLDELELREPVAVAGLSMGGYVAFEVLRQGPDRVRALGLFSTRAAPDSAEQRQGRLKLVERIQQEGMGVLAETVAPKLTGPTTASIRPDLLADITRWALAASPQGVTDALRAMAGRADSRPLLGSIACPTLVVAGREDLVIPSADMEAMAAAIPGAQFDSIPDAGHLVNLEQPERFHEILARWLRQL